MFKLVKKDEKSIPNIYLCCFTVWPIVTPAIIVRVERSLSNVANVKINLAFMKESA